jgi:hypothetical protein
MVQSGVDLCEALPPRPAELADWPISWRERWGRLANDLEARGTPFPESEAQAFRHVKIEIGAGAIEPATLAETPRSAGVLQLNPSGKIKLAAKVNTSG